MKMIHRALAVVLSVFSTLLLAGCFQAEQVINVKPDGTGTIVMTIKMTKEAVEQMKAFGGQDPANADPVAQMFKVEETDAMAKKMGEGVKLVKVEPVQEGNLVGKRATFSFPDINKVRADMSMGPNSGDDNPDSEPIKFEFTKGSPSTLVIHSPSKKNKEVKPDDPQEDAQLAAMAGMLKDMRIAIAVNVEGQVVNTDAENREGSRIVLVDLPVGEAMKDIKKFKAIDRATEWSAAAKVIKEIPGAKVESKEVVKVQFK